MKSSFNDLKDQGVTAELIQAVDTEERRRNPTEYKNISAMKYEVAAYDQKKIETLREQRQQKLALQRQEVTVDKDI